MWYQFKRQVIFGAALSVLIIGSALAGYYFFRPNPTCNDGIQNQKEEGVDCGGPCADCRSMSLGDIKILSYKSFLADDGNYDSFAEVRNVNADYGTAEFQYAFHFYNADSKLIAERSGKSFILAGQTRYVIENNIQLSEPAALVDFTIKSGVVWEKQSLYAADLPVFSVKYELASQGQVKFAKVTGTLENKTGYDFSNVEVGVLLVDKDDRPIAVGKTRVDNFRFGESRLFTVLFPDKTPTPGNIYARAATNIFDASNVR